MGNQIQKVLCCKCCKKAKEKIFKRRISIQPKNGDLYECLLPISEDSENKPIINNLSEFKFNASDCILKHRCNPKEFYEFDPIEDKIGEGAFGVVYKVKSKKFKFIRAMKKIAKAKLINPNDSDSFVNEIKILQKFRDRYGRPVSRTKYFDFCTMVFGGVDAWIKADLEGILTRFREYREALRGGPLIVPLLR